MDKQIRDAMKYVSGYLLGTVLFTVVVGAFVLALKVWS